MTTTPANSCPDSADTRNSLPVLIPFNILRTAQAAAVLLKAEPGRRVSRLRLLKLLYVADRELLSERGRPITGDRPVAMGHGPVLSRTYDLIQGTDYRSPQWERFFRGEGRRDVALARDPGVGRLSRREILKLQEVSARYEGLDDWAVADLTRRFPEWEKNKPAEGACRDIPLEDLLDATGMAESRDGLLEAGRLAEAAERLFGE